MRLPAVCKIVLLALAYTGSKAGAAPIHSVNLFYSFELTTTGPVSFSWGLRENPAAPPYELDLAVLFFADFTNDFWGSTFLINSSNTPDFDAFIAQITDGEVDYLATLATSDVGNMLSTVTEPWFFHNDGTGLSGIDLTGYDITHLEISFVESHIHDWLRPRFQGLQTVTFHGSARSVPDTAGVAGLLTLGLAALGILRRLGLVAR